MKSTDAGICSAVFLCMDSSSSSSLRTQTSQSICSPRPNAVVYFAVLCNINS